MTEKELVKYIQYRLQEVIDSIELTSKKDTACELETKCLYEYLIMQCSNAKRFIEIICMKEWSKNDLLRVYYLVYNSILSIELLIEREKDTFGYCGYAELDDLLIDCLQSLNSQMLLTDESVCSV